LENKIVGDLGNYISGEIINLSKTNASHLISSAVRVRGVSGGLPHIAAMQNIHYAMAGAIPTEPTEDEKNQRDVKNVQRYYGAVRYENTIYRACMLVKIYGGSKFIELEGVKKLYDMKLDKKHPNPYPSVLTNISELGASSSAFRLTIEQLLKDVKEKPLLSR